MSEEAGVVNITGELAFAVKETLRSLPAGVVRNIEQVEANGNVIFIWAQDGSEYVATINRRPTIEKGASE